MASEAAFQRSVSVLFMNPAIILRIPIPLSLTDGAGLDEPDFSSLDDSLRVCEDGVREKVDARGPRCVSLSSTQREGMISDNSVECI